MININDDHEYGGVVDDDDEKEEETITTVIVETAVNYGKLRSKRTARPYSISEKFTWGRPQISVVEMSS